jgi:CBS domain-containing protein
MTSESQAYGKASLNHEATVRVADLMQRKVKTIASDATVAEAIVSLADAHISGMPVVDGTGRVIGIVSSTDVLTAEAEAGDRDARQALLDATTVRDVMTPRPYTIAPEEDIREAACQMLYGEVHRLFVAEGDQVVGIITTTDIVRAVATGKL